MDEAESAVLNTFDIDVFEPKGGRLSSITDPPSSVLGTFASRTSETGAALSGRFARRHVTRNVVARTANTDSARTDGVTILVDLGGEICMMEELK